MSYNTARRVMLRIEEFPRDELWYEFLIHNVVGTNHVKTRRATILTINVGASRQINCQGCLVHDSISFLVKTPLSV